MKPDEVDVLHAEALKRERRHKAQFFVDEKKKRQRDLASSTMGKKVFDILQFPDVNGDDIVIWVFSDLKTRDLSDGEHVVVMISLSEPDRQYLVFDEAVFKSGRLWTPAGEILVRELQQGSYSY